MPAVCGRLHCLSLRTPIKRQPGSCRTAAVCRDQYQKRFQRPRPSWMMQRKPCEDAHSLRSFTRVSFSPGGDTQIVGPEYHRRLPFRRGFAYGPVFFLPISTYEEMIIHMDVFYQRKLVFQIRYPPPKKGAGPFELSSRLNTRMCAGWRPNRASRASPWPTGSGIPCRPGAFPCRYWPARPPFSAYRRFCR